MNYPASTKKLVNALENEKIPKLEAIIRRAKRNEFHDYLSDSATPIMNLVMALQKAGFPKLANRARNGDFDATPQEWDAWAASDEGRLTLAELTGGFFIPPNQDEHP